MVINIPSASIPTSLIGTITAIPSEIMPHKYRSAAAAFVFSLSALAPFPGLLGISYSIRENPVNGWR